MTRTRTRALVLAAAAVLAALLGTAVTAQAKPGTPPIRHVLVVNLENKGYDTTWGAGSKAPYLSRTLRAKGVLLTRYFGIGHNSLTNYVAQISGQGPNPQTQADCPVYTSFTRITTAAPGQAVGSGCVYPSSVPTLAGQLTKAGRTWKGYMEDMRTSCRHPAAGAVDGTQQAKAGDQYAARHNPFVYFASITNSSACARDVDLSVLRTDLKSVRTTPNLAYITPNLCHDGHDAPCADGAPGGLVSADAWLRTWVPRIMASPAFRRDGMLVITFDESDSAFSDASACCGEGTSPNTPLPGIIGPGGGRVGALVISPKYVEPASWNDTPYNHYSLLASIEDLFGLPHLGYAGSAPRFGLDVYNRVH